MRVLLVCGIVLLAATTARADETGPATTKFTLSGPFDSNTSEAPDAVPVPDEAPVPDDPPQAPPAAVKPRNTVTLQVKVFNCKPAGFSESELGERDVLLGKILDAALPKKEGNIQARRWGPCFGKAKSEVLLPLIESLQEKHVVTKIAEVNLSTEDGRRNSFFSGSEFFIFSPQPNGKTLKYAKTFGTEITIVPWVLVDGAIRIRFEFEHSEKDYSVKVRDPQGELIPGLHTMKMCPTFEGSLDETFVLCIHRLPVTPEHVGILGKLVTGQKAEKAKPPAEPVLDLIVFITPTAVTAPSVVESRIRKDNSPFGEAYIRDEASRAAGQSPR